MAKEALVLENKAVTFTQTDYCVWDSQPRTTLTIFQGDESFERVYFPSQTIRLTTAGEIKALRDFLNKVMPPENTQEGAKTNAKI